MPIEGADYFVYIVPFPNYAADGFVVSNGDGTCSVLLNANTTLERQRDAMDHELVHIQRDDLFREGDVTEMEAAAG